MGCSGDTYRKIVVLLREHGAVLKKSKKHSHWVFPSGAAWIVPRSPKSDSGFYHNLADLKKFLRTGDPVCAPCRAAMLQRVAVAGADGH